MRLFDKKMFPYIIVPVVSNSVWFKLNQLCYGYGYIGTHEGMFLYWYIARCFQVFYWATRYNLYVQQYLHQKLASNHYYSMFCM